MTPERFRQIRNLFDAAVERPTEARPAFLQEACQGDEDLREAVSRLLSAHQQTEDGPLQQPPILRGDAGRMEGRCIDHYEILRELGRGGMGSVYLAVRTDQVYRKAVALKVVRPEASSEDVRRRFHQEREILASLDHPNIARLLDGGATPEGLPYLVMEFVDGQPIDTFCDAHQMNVPERLNLFRTVCAAVEYAHGRGVAHRDLKPGNILVTSEGAVKLLDFGIAKLLDEDAEDAASLTRTGLRPMTPEYASPEQVKGETVGAASDQYSLGVVLYELLTGHRPYRMRSRLIHEVVRVICEEDPTLPSTAVTETRERMTPQLISRSRETTPAELRRALAGDLDNILLKALRKNPAQRYASVQGLCEDLQRHLDGHPITAQAHSLIYRIVKFLKRHPGWIGATAALGFGLATGMIKVSPLAVASLLAFCLGLTVFYLRSRGDFGPEAAAEKLASSWQVWMLAIVIPGLVCMSAVAAWIAKSGAAVRVETVLLSALAVLTPPIAAANLVLLAGWFSRKFWAGRRLLELGRPEPRMSLLSWGSTLFVMFMVLLEMGLLKNKPDARPWQIDGAEFLMLIALVCLVVTRKVEFRERGILCYGLLTRWQELESFTWDRPSGKSVVLKLRFRDRLPFLPATKVVVPSDRRDAADAVLRRQLAEWPDSKGSVTEPEVTQ